MSEGSEKLYTPFVLRTGFMHSYRRTIPLLGLTALLEFILWTMADFWPRFVELAYIRWGIMIILTFVVPIGVWTIRDIVAGYDDLFDVFDEETEENLKLYRSMDRTSSETQEEMKSLFKDQETYDSFRDGARQIIFSKIEIVFVLLVISITVFFVSSTSLYPKIILGTALSAYPLVILEIASDILSSLFMSLSISLLIVLGLGYLRTISHLGASRSDFRVWNYIRYLQGIPSKDASFMSYWKFYDCTSMLGRHFSRIAFRIVLIMVLGGLSQVLFNTPNLVIWILAGLNIVTGVLILALPLNSLHRVMLEAKTAVMNELEEEYDHLTLGFVSQLRELRHSEKTGRSGKREVELATKLTALRGIILEAKLHRVTPIELPAVLRILATSMIPVIVALMNVILRALGIVSG